ncbi:hypothetical protein [Streptomyces filamentosus]|uniref:hypothetical protein n=1 Tax=Streptomyces filamentosus TaxID=67294 RepID=UPI00123B0A6C|nr:hypothetical protein [Streptomyces filamentosus]KAA6210388.1 hypothetical protein CP979_27885 [Streptomyces filamentosus]
MGLLSWLRGTRGTERPARADAPATAPASAAASREDRFDLVELPPLQRTLDAPALVTDPSAFERGLSTRRPTALSTPLGHLVSAEAPGGLAGGVATPVQRSLVEFSVRASGGGPSLGSPGDVSGGSGDRLPASASGAVSAPASASLSGAPAPGRAALPEPVQRTAFGPAPTGASFPSGPGPVEVRRTPETSGGVTEPPAAPEAPETPEALGGPPAPDLVGTPEPRGDGGTAELPVRPLVGEQPLLEVPEPGPLPAETSGGGLPPVQRSPSPAPGTPPPPASAPSSRRPSGLGAPLPALPPTAQREAPGAAPVPAPRSVPPEPAPPPLPAPAPEPVPEPVAPLLADRPLVLRTVAPEAGATATSPIGVPPGPVSEAPAVPVRWETPAVQRHTPLTATSTTGTTVTAAPAPPPAPVQRAVAPSVPAAPRAPRDAGDVAVAAGVAQRMADGSVVFAPPSPSAARRALPPGTFVQREAATEDPPPPAPEEPTGAVPDPVPDPAPDPGAEAEGNALSAYPSSPGGASSGAPPAAPPVTDEFVRALYPPLARLFKAELRLERERAGRLIETRF